MRFHQLDTLRFVFALLVVCGHAMTWSGPLKNAGLAVDFFFVLSGFVLAHQILASRPTFPKFALTRLARLWPLHIATLIAATTMANQIDWPAVWANVGMIQDAGLFDRLTGNHPAWSISAEMIIGLLILYPLAKYRAIKSAVVLVAISICLIAYSGLNMSQMHVQRLGPLSLGLVRCTLGCAIGYLAYEFFRKWGLPIKGYALDAVQIAMFGLFLAIFAMPLSNLALIGTPLVAAAMVIVFASNGRFVSSTLGSTHIRWMGEISFGVYMVHRYILNQFITHGLLPHDVRLWKDLTTGHAQHHIIPLAVFFATVLTVAIGSHRVLEMPAKRMILRLPDLISWALMLRRRSLPSGSNRHRPLVSTAQRSGPMLSGIPPS